MFQHNGRNLVPTESCSTVFGNLNPAHTHTHKTLNRHSSKSQSYLKSRILPTTNSSGRRQTRRQTDSSSFGFLYHQELD